MGRRFVPTTDVLGQELPGACCLMSRGVRRQPRDNERTVSLLAPADSQPGRRTMQSVV